MSKHCFWVFWLVCLRTVFAKGYPEAVMVPTCQSFPMKLDPDLRYNLTSKMRLISRNDGRPREQRVAFSLYGSSQSVLVIFEVHNFNWLQSRKVT
jgi:hypothetical protein